MALLIFLCAQPGFSTLQHILSFLPDDPPACDILQHVTQSDEDPPHSFQLAGCSRHRVLVQDFLLQTQTAASLSIETNSIVKIAHAAQRGKQTLGSFSIAECEISELGCYQMLSAINYGERKKKEWMSHNSTMSLWLQKSRKICHFKDQCFQTHLKYLTFLSWRTHRNLIAIRSQGHSGTRLMFSQFLYNSYSCDCKNLQVQNLQKEQQRIRALWGRSSALFELLVFLPARWQL